jgi:hypothetical protein
MIRSLIQEAALSAAKAHCHAEVEARHVLFALARHFRQRPECEAFLPLAKRALEPSGSWYETPVMSDAAATMLDTLESDAAGISALQQAFQTTGDPSGGVAAGTQATQVDPQEAGQVEEATEVGSDDRESIDDILGELDSLTGLGHVKAQVRKLIAVVQANTERERAGLKPVMPGLHLVFTGPGANFTEASRSDLVAGYVGQTAIKTSELINRTRPGVLFIDEAYALTPKVDVDFGHEAVATLVKAMEDHRHEFAVIVAGYQEEMTDFIVSNPGLRSRFKTYVDFPDYSPSELAEIFEGMVRDVGIELADGALAAAENLFTRAAEKQDFGNARFARSLFEQAYARMAARAADDGSVTLDELQTLLPEDIDDNLSMLDEESPRIGF